MLSYVLGTQIVHSNNTQDVCSPGPNVTVTSDQYASWSNEIYSRLFYYQLGHSIVATLMFVVTLCGEFLVCVMLQDVGHMAICNVT